MLTIKVKCKGVTPLLINRMTEEQLLILDDKTKKPAKTASKAPPRERCAEKVYEHNGKPFLPSAMLLACFINAGQYIRLDGKRQVSTAKSTMLPAFLTLLDAELPLYEVDSKKAAKWEVDMRKGTNPNGNEAVCIFRPRFDVWAFEFRCSVDDHEIGEDVIRDLVDKAGRRIGLGDFRPARKGPFGQFVVEEWKRISDEEAHQD